MMCNLNIYCTHLHIHQLSFSVEQLKENRNNEYSKTMSHTDRLISVIFTHIKPK